MLNCALYHNNPKSRILVLDMEYVYVMIKKDQLTINTVTNCKNVLDN